MEVKFLSSNEQATFNEAVHEGSEVTKLFFLFMSELEANCDHDTVMVSFDDEVLRASIEDSSFLVLFDEASQSVILEKYDEIAEGHVYDREWDFDEDAVEELVDYVSGQIFYGDEEIDQS